jgi:Ca2+-transporting ATPase
MKLIHKGLNDSEVISSRNEFGNNSITPQESEGFLDKLVDNLKDPTIIILLISLAIITLLAWFGYAEWYEGVGIAVAVVIATGVATWSEYKNESAFQRLLEEASQIQVKVFRNGGSTQLGIEELVVGDCVLLQPGDKVPADGVLIDGNMQIDQASLTGESDHVNKTAIGLDGPRSPNDDLHDPNWVFRGGVVVDGEAVVELVAVGDRTFYGRLAQEMQGAERDSPLKVKLKALADDIGKFGTIGAILIAIAFMFQKLFLERGLTLETLFPYLSEIGNYPLLISDAVTAVILAVVIVVVAVPEGLPMMIAIVLSINMRKLLSDKVLVRKLLGIEAAGSLNILFSDKTGTLTRGVLQVSTVMTPGGERYASYDEIPVELRELVGLSLKHNSIAVVDIDKDDKLNIIGADRTEQALLRYIEPLLRTKDDVEITDAIPFSSARKFSAVQFGVDPVSVLVKGAPELVLANCTSYYDKSGSKQILGQEVVAALTQEMDGMSTKSMRLLAIAIGESPLDDSRIMPSDLSLVAILGLRDELREESRIAVQTAHDAGIHVVMVTGDRKETAQAIAQDVGLLDPENAMVLTSAELESMEDREIRDILPKLKVVARAYPHQKARLVRIAQELNLVGGMTGDGVNDAAALKRSDVGFSMGSGTEVAKEAGDIVILDDNFSSLTRAVLYGRTLFKSIRKFLVFQLTVNVSAILVAFLGPFFGFDLPLTMIQLLWINLIMDTLAALAFSGEAALDRYMKESPIPRDTPLISADMWSSILINGVVIAVLSITFLLAPEIRGVFRNDAAFMTGFFAFFVFINNFNKFNARTERMNLFENILDNKGFLPVVGLIFAVQILFTYLGGDVLRTVGLTFDEWLFVIAFSFVIIPIDLARKSIRDAIFRNKARPLNEALSQA